MKSLPSQIRLLAPALFLAVSALAGAAQAEVQCSNVQLPLVFQLKAACTETTALSAEDVASINDTLTYTPCISKSFAMNAQAALAAQRQQDAQSCKEITELMFNQISFSR